MARGPDKPREVFCAYAEDVQRAFGEELEGVIAHGDAVTGDYDPLRSNIDFLVAVEDASFARIKSFAPVVASWHRRRVATPTIVSSEYIQASLDSSPIEFLNMSLFHDVVLGDDVLSGLEFERERLRIHCERESKHQVQRIKETYLDREGELKEIARLVAESIDDFVPILRALIYLRGKRPPGPRLKVFKAAGKVLNLSERVFARALCFRNETVRDTKAECERFFDAYVRQLEHVSEIADELEETVEAPHPRSA